MVNWDDQGTSYVEPSAIPLPKSKTTTFNNAFDPEQGDMKDSKLV